MAGATQVNREQFKLVVLLAILATCLTSHAKTGNIVRPAQSQRVSIPRLSVPPRLEDFLDMQPSAAVSGKMARIANLVQREPKDGAPASERTEVYLGYDEKNFYAVFIAFDSEPSKLRASMTRREGIQSDDTVGILLDTFHDRQRAYEFLVNPYGIQLDGIAAEGQNDDYNFDTLWYSRGRRTEHGYVVWIAIPFKSVRFSAADAKTWGVSVLRGIPRNNEMDFWPYMTRNLAGFGQQMADMDGLNGISAGRNMQFIPYGLFRNFRALDERDPAAPRFDHKVAKLDAGLDSKFILRDSFVLDTTINPDFSQIESDEPQVTVNQRFEVFFPEKRPFFLENASYFLTPINLFFTRRIANPTYGARLTGRLGRFNVGMLVADDRGPGKTVPTTDPVAGKRAWFSVGRLSRDIGKDSLVGLMYTDREFEGSYNRVGGADFRFKLNPKWVVSGQAVASSTRDLDGSYLAGPAFEFDLDRSSRKLRYNLHYQGRSPGFRTETGFDPQPDINWITNQISYTFRPEGKHLLNWGPWMQVYRNYDHDGNVLNWGYEPELRAELSRQTYIHAGYAEEAELLRPIDFPVLTRNVEYVRNTKYVYLESGYFRQVQWTVDYRFGRRINYDAPEGQIPFLATRHQATFTAAVKPFDRLQIDNTYIWFRLRDTDSGHNVFNNHIIRSKWNYQFTRALSFRFIGEYDAVLANPQFTSLTNTKRFNADVLFTYLLHPGTAVYVGYNSNVQNLYPDLRIDADQNLLRTRNRFINDGRQFFIKISYLLRF